MREQVPPAPPTVFRKRELEDPKALGSDDGVCGWVCVGVGVGVCVYLV